MASAGTTLECLLVRQSATMPGVTRSWHAMQVFVAGLISSLSPGSFFSGLGFRSRKYAVRKDEQGKT